MKLPMFQVNAFTRRLGGGNPAGVVPLSEWLPDELMQLIAAENNLSETAFFVVNRSRSSIELRWFTPTTEVDLCGHATLAAAYVLFSELGYQQGSINFDTRSGRLFVAETPLGLSLTMPADPPQQQALSPAVIELLGVEPLWSGIASYWLAELPNERAVKDLQLNAAALAELEERPLIVTAKGERCDFVSRFFAPTLGIDEDPVTGSAHTILTPYWAAKMGRDELEATQLSARGGDLICRLDDGQVELTGHCRLYFKGHILASG